MARLNVATQQIVRTGLEPTLAGPPNVDGDVVDSGQVALWVDNASGGSINVTVEATATQDGQNVEDLVVAVPAGEARLIGPLPRRTFGQPAGAVESGSDDQGRVYVDYSAQTSVTRAVVAF